jgi:hypothetical protein
MTTPNSWRPQTGADSIPSPPTFRDPDSPQARGAWARYWRECEEAAARETVNEAIVRCRAEADCFEHGAARFEVVLETLDHALDRHVADLAGPEGEKWRGFSLDESSIYGLGHVRALATAYGHMEAAWTDLNREAYRKAAAEFASILADLSFGMVPVTPARKGAAA